ncbi:hypothetical protein [Actinomadura chibensis]|uniref:Uncharacterized protein n=1 Tax=Actinomadura chibensis TaxID=392828 RepID=A0A5D0NMH7_9ACTN|nr:hypothetical protein [Actinomadura chibensis]TYB45713.1 hypothetical protein FXF69_20085 [Actinomadura chibensis]
MPEKTWGDGEYTEDDVIESADHTGYTSVSDYVHDENALAPDPVDDFATDVGSDDYGVETDF